MARVDAKGKRLWKLRPEHSHGGEDDVSRYENRRHEIDFSAPVEWVTLDQYAELWNVLEAVDRWGNGKLAEDGHEAIWDFEKKCWVGIKHE
jgi:hypothetical protein